MIPYLFSSTSLFHPITSQAAQKHYFEAWRLGSTDVLASMNFNLKGEVGVGWGCHLSCRGL